MKYFFCRVASEGRIDATQLKNSSMLASSPSLTVLGAILLMMQALVYLTANASLFDSKR